MIREEHVIKISKEIENIIIKTCLFKNRIIILVFISMYFSNSKYYYGKRIRI